MQEYCVARHHDDPCPLPCRGCEEECDTGVVVQHEDDGSWGVMVDGVGHYWPYETCDDARADAEKILDDREADARGERERVHPVHGE